MSHLLFSYKTQKRTLSFCFVSICNMICHVIFCSLYRNDKHVWNIICSTDNVVRLLHFCSTETFLSLKNGGAKPFFPPLSQKWNLYHCFPHSEYLGRLPRYIDGHPSIFANLLKKIVWESGALRDWLICRVHCSRTSIRQVSEMATNTTMYQICGKHCIF